MRRLDTATLVILAFTVLAFLVFLWIVSTAPAKSSTAKVWQPYPAALFSRWPAVPVDAGPGPDYAGGRPSSSRTPGDLSLVERRVTRPSRLPDLAPSILPSVRPHPTGGLIPPYLGFRGLAGTSTWYAYHSGQAAAGRALRAAIGADWRGATVRVCHAGRCLSVILTDYESSPLPGRLIDLDSRDFQRLCGPLSIGVCSVEVDYNG